MGRAGALIALPLAAVHAATAAPALPPQPGVPPASCASATATGSWTRDVVDNAPGGSPSYQVAVDPWTPCRLFRAIDGETVQRSTDGGTTWTTVFHDNASNLPGGAGNPIDPSCTTPGDCPLGGPFEASGLYVLAQHRVVLAERTNGDAVVVSDDGGTTWNIATGFAGADGHSLTPLGSSVLQIAFAPSNPMIGYAVVGVKLQADQEGLCAAPTPGDANVIPYATHDGGESWAPATGAGSSSTDISAEPVLRIDPKAPTHGLEVQGGYVRRTTDGFAHSTTAPATGQGPQGHAVDAAIVPTRAHPQRLLVATASGLFATDDDFQTSRQVIPDVLTSIRMATDPQSPDRVLVAAMDATTCTARMYTSDDGFDTYRSLSAPPDGTVPQAHSPLRMDGWMAADSVLQPLPGGVFYMTGCSDGCHTQAVWHIDPHAPGGGPHSPSPLARGRLPDLRSCQQPSGLTQLSQTDNNAAIAFDGHDILYTRTGESATAPFQGLIRRLSPDCRTAGTITVRFDPRDLASAEPSQSLITHPIIDDVAYDALRNAIWFTLATSDPAGDTVQAPGIFMARIDSATTTADTATAHLLFATPGCVSFFSYGYPGDSLWTCPTGATTTGGGGRLGRIQASTGAPEPSCFASGFGFRPADWVFVEPRYMYVQDEDDTTLHLVDATDCREIDTFLHRTYGERAEDEQQACDSITFADPGLGLAMWNRDVLDHGEFSAYRLPAGTCRFPTELHAPVVTVVQGAAADYCAELRQDWPGGTSPIEGRSVAFGGVGNGVLRPRGSGSECASISSSGLSIGDHAVSLRFDGDAQFLPATATGVLRVVARPPSALAAPSAAHPPRPAARPRPPVLPLVAPRPATLEPPASANPPPATVSAAAQAPAPASGRLTAGVIAVDEETQVATEGRGRTLRELSFSRHSRPSGLPLGYGAALALASVVGYARRRTVATAVARWQ